jgi:hypothetical protein
VTVLRNPDTGSIIQATGRLEQRLIDQGWTVTDQPPSPGLRIVTAAELDQLTSTVQGAIGASQADRTDLRDIVEPMAVQLPVVAAEVDQLAATFEATTSALAPKPTPRTDALEAWRVEAEAALDAIQSTIAAIDIPSAVEAWLTANPPPAGADGIPGLPGPQGDPGPAGADGVDGLPGLPGTNDYLLLLNRPNLHAVATSGAYADLTGKPTIPAAVVARKVIVNTGSLTANTVKTVALSFSPAMPDTAYAVVATVETSTPQTVAVGLVANSRTVNGCSLAVRSTAAVNAQGLNVHVVGLA